MQPVSDFWLPAMEAEELTIISYGQVFPPLAAGPGLAPLAAFDVVNGSVTADAGNAVRRSASSIEMVPQEFDRYGLPVPTSASDLLFPDGAELELYKGCLYPTDDPAYVGAPMISLPWVNAGAPTPGEMVPLGRFLMEDVEIYNSPTSGSVYVQLNGSDRSATVSRAVFTAPYSTNGTSTVDVQVKALLNSQVSGLTFSFSPGTGAFPVPASQSFAIGADPFAAAAAIAASVGFELFFDVVGTLVMRPVPDPTTTATSWVYADGASNIVTDMQRSLINSGVPNLIIVISQGSNVATPIQSVWWDSNPNSPTFYNSTVPTIGSSNVVPSPQGTYPTTTVTSTSSAATSQAANDAAAQAIFIASHGAFETIDMKIRDNAAQDVEDVIQATSVAAGILNSLYVLDTITYQMDYSTQQEQKGRLVLA